MGRDVGLSPFHRGIPQAILGGIVGAFFTRVLQVSDFLPRGIVVWMIGAAVMTFVAWGINKLLLSGSGAGATALYVPSGRTTAYTPTFSQIEALEVKGDLAGAARAWEAACTEFADNPLVHVKAADFHLRKRKDATRALKLYRTACEHAGSNKELQRYAQAKIIDLYLGPLKDEGKAMIELRRMIERAPGTREADEARAALAQIKASRHER